MHLIGATCIAVTVRCGQSLEADALQALSCANSASCVWLEGRSADRGRGREPNKFGRWVGFPGEIFSHAGSTTVLVGELDLQARMSARRFLASRSLSPKPPAV